MKTHSTFKRAAFTGFIALGLVGFAGSSYGQNACRALFAFAGHAIESLDPAFQALQDSRPDKETQAKKVMPLLNRAFFPMLKDFRTAIEKTSDQHVVDELRRARETYPILTSSHTGHDARIPNYPRAESLVRHNSGLAVDQYRVVRYPNVIHHKNFIYVRPDEERVRRMGILHNQFSLVMTPVGEYGRSFAENLLRTTQIMMNLAEQTLKESSRAAYRANPELLSRETARVMGAAREEADIESAPLSAMQEGILSFHQLFNLVTAEKIPGVETGTEALRLFVQGGTTHIGLTSELTVRMPMGIVGPMTMAGVSFRDALMINEHGRLQVTGSLKETLAKLMDFQTRFMRRKGVCPMATFFRGQRARAETAANASASETPIAIDQTTGLQMLAEMYWRVFKIVEATPAGIPIHTSSVLNAIHSAAPAANPPATKASGH